jgi:RecB family exonuclease
LKHPSLPFPIKKKPKVDRIEERNAIRIIDYKTGKVEKTNVSLKSQKGERYQIRKKFIQVLAYTLCMKMMLKANQLRLELFRSRI